MTLTTLTPNMSLSIPRENLAAFTFALQRAADQVALLENLEPLQQYNRVIVSLDTFNAAIARVEARMDALDEKLDRKLGQLQERVDRIVTK